MAKEPARRPNREYLLKYIQAPHALTYKSPYDQALQDSNECGKREEGSSILIRPVGVANWVLGE